MRRTEQDPSTGQPIQLTTNERKVLISAAQGRSLKQTTKALGISYNTGRFFLDRLRSKTGQGNTVAAVMQAYRSGIITPEEVHNSEPFPDSVRKRPLLTRREAEVLVWMMEGLSRREIARTLHISPNTVGTHITHIFDHLGVSSKEEAVAVALQRIATLEDNVV